MKMRRCEDEKMFYRPPTIGRTLRSDALGNNRIHREKLTKIGHLTLDHMHADAYTNHAL